MGSAQVEEALGRIAAETSVSRILHASCRELVELLAVQRAVISRVIGDLIVELSEHNLRTDERRLELFLLADYPLTQAMIEDGGPRVVVRSDPEADPAETALLAERGFGSLLMLPLISRGTTWGIVEVYADENGFGGDQVETATALIARVGELLAAVESAA